MEKPAVLTDNDIVKALQEIKDRNLFAVVESCNDKYDYWTTVKYKARKYKMEPLDLWCLVKATRKLNYLEIWSKYNIKLYVTNQMQRACYEFDTIANSWQKENLLLNDKNEKYSISSLMEEAIFSSRMEGAATTRKVAKEMLLKRTSPKDRSQQMIVNNYNTINYIREHCKEKITEQMLLTIHSLMTKKTLNNSEDAGRFRQNDDIVVADELQGEIIHTPPSYKEIPEFIASLCDFCNEEKQDNVFIHPIIRGIIVHFMLAFVHPFVDGNGRTARALFYWYMMRQGYSFTQYLSISRVIARSKTSYEKAFLYTENDENDIGYFVAYNLRVLQLSIEQLNTYLLKKQQEKNVANSILAIGGINERQSEIIVMFSQNSSLLVTAKDISLRLNVSINTAKADLNKLCQMNILKQISLNQRKRGYVKGDNFDTQLNR